MYVLCAYVWCTYIYDPGPWSWCMHVSMMYVSMMRLKFCHQRTNQRTNGQGDSRSWMRKLTSDIVRLEIHSWYDSLWPLLYSHTIQPSQVMVEHSVGASWGAYSNPETCNIIQKKSQVYWKDFTLETNSKRVKEKLLKSTYNPRISLFGPLVPDHNE